MAEPQPPGNSESNDALDRAREEIDYSGRHLGPRLLLVVSLIAIAWSLFQLWLASPFPFMFGVGIVLDVPSRAIHLAFAMALCFLVFPAARSLAGARLPLYDVALALIAAATALYVAHAHVRFARSGILDTVTVAGMTVPYEAIVGGVGIVLLLEATRRAVGLPLVIIAGVFLVYSIFGQSMPEIVSHKGVSLERLIGYHWLAGEAIFGIPIDVSVKFVFLFVLFGAMLEKAGAGKYFLDLAFAMVGRYRGGPAKAAIIASGMTGAISGSSIANVVTTGTFTIPVMKRLGLPAVKAGAIEVAASTNGQIMPPIMGAAAFIIAEFLGITYFEVIKAAFIPAVISYIALLYISHLESMKLGIRGMPDDEVPSFRATFMSGAHFLLPIVILIYLLIFERWSPEASVFYSIVVMMLIILAQNLVALRNDPAQALIAGLVEVLAGLIAGARNMIGIAIAVGTAGIIVGSVASTGLNNAMVGVVEALSGGNVYILLALTAVLCLLLGMGLPTTANYLVVASLLAGVLVELGGAAGLVLPLIAVHLYVFYFGLMADSTPPVCLAAFAASAISRADPLKTGVQSFFYDIRTAILPVVFIFNPQLLLIGVESVPHGILVFVVSLIAILCFTSITQRWMFVRLNLVEMAVLAAVTFALFRPDAVMNRLYPPYATVDIASFVAGQVTPDPDRLIRLHVTRETRYGDRYKLFALQAPPVAGTAEPAARYGFTLDTGQDGRFVVVDLAFQGLAETAGLDFGDYVTAVDIEQLGQPSPKLVYPFALLLLGGVLWSQLTRRRRMAAPAAG